MKKTYEEIYKETMEPRTLDVVELMYQDIHPERFSMDCAQSQEIYGRDSKETSFSQEELDEEKFYKEKYHEHVAAGFSFKESREIALKALEKKILEVFGEIE